MSEVITSPRDLVSFMIFHRQHFSIRSRVVSSLPSNDKNTRRGSRAECRVIIANCCAIVINRCFRCHRRVSEKWTSEQSAQGQQKANEAGGGRATAGVRTIYDLFNSLFISYEIEQIACLFQYSNNGVAIMICFYTSL